VVDAPASDAPPVQPAPPPARKKKKPFYKVW
jgi:hypothetical protein